MANAVKKIRENMEKSQNLKKYMMYGSLIGSCIVTIGKLAQKSENELIEEFDKLYNDEEFAKCKNVVEVCDYLVTYFKVNKKYLDNVILVYDENNVYTPCVTLELDNTILPLDPYGMGLGILAHLDNESVYYEYVYGEEEDNED